MRQQHYSNNQAVPEISRIPPGRDTISIEEPTGRAVQAACLSDFGLDEAAVLFGPPP